MVVERLVYIVIWMNVGENLVTFTALVVNAFTLDSKSKSKPQHCSSLDRKLSISEVRLPPIEVNYSRKTATWRITTLPKDRMYKPADSSGYDAAVAENSSAFDMLPWSEPVCAHKKCTVLQILSLICVDMTCGTSMHHTRAKYSLNLTSHDVGTAYKHWHGISLY